jgi:uncharacterized membrane protein YgcG
MEAAAWIGLILLVIALSIFGYVLDARAHGGARLRGDYGGGDCSEGGGGFSGGGDCSGGGGTAAAATE